MQNGPATSALEYAPLRKRTKFDPVDEYKLSQKYVELLPPLAALGNNAHGNCDVNTFDMEAYAPEVDVSATVESTYGDVKVSKA